MIVERISARLALPMPYLQRLASTASHRYKEYKIDKRTGGQRTIHHPAKELKLIQRWLLRNVLNGLPIHSAATAYRHNGNIARNAERHVDNNYLLRVDFREFFPSLTSGDVRTVLRRNRQILSTGGATDEDISFMTRIICRDGRLTIGAPTSPLVSNAIMFEFDETWSGVATGLNVIYSRYADDLYFSTNRPNVLQEVLNRLRGRLTSEHRPFLTINERKTAFSSRKYRRLVAGLVLTSDRKISIGRNKKRMLRAIVNRLSHRQLQPQEIHQLRGWIAYVRSVEPTFVTSLQRKYNIDFEAGQTWEP
jgi:hypothetical protein